MNFSRKSIDILFELKLRDSKEYYEERKPEYKKLVTEPFVRLAAELESVFKNIDSELVCTPKCVSRVRRDTRFTRDKSLFRDHIWLNVSRPRERMGNTLSFYFCIMQTGFSYGCGYYQTPTKVMESLRKIILDNGKEYIDVINMLENSPQFSLDGEMYKKNRFPDESEDKQFWLNRKSISVNASSNDYELLFSDRLIPFIKSEFEKLAPVYKLCLKAEEMSKEAEI